MPCLTVAIKRLLREYVGTTYNTLHGQFGCSTWPGQAYWQARDEIYAEASEQNGRNSLRLKSTTASSRRGIEVLTASPWAIGLATRSRCQTHLLSDGSDDQTRERITRGGWSSTGDRHGCREAAGLQAAAIHRP